MYHYGSTVKDQEECLKLCVLREIGKDLTQLQGWLFSTFFVSENLRNHIIITTIGSTSDHRHHVSLRIYWI